MLQDAIDGAGGTVEEAAARLAKAAAEARARGPLAKHAAGPDLAALWASAKDQGGRALEGFRGLPTAAQGAIAGAGLGALGGGAAALASGKSRRRALDQALFSGAMGGALGGGAGFVSDRLADPAPVESPEGVEALFKQKLAPERLATWYAGAAPEGTTLGGIAADAIKNTAEAGPGAVAAAASAAGGLAADHPGVAGGLLAGHLSRGRELAARNELARYRAGLAGVQGAGGEAAAEALRLERALDAAGGRFGPQRRAMRGALGSSDVARQAYGVGGRAQQAGEVKPLGRTGRTGLLRSLRGPAAGLLVDRLAGDYLDDPATSTGWLTDLARKVPGLGGYIPR